MVQWVTALTLTLPTCAAVLALCHSTHPHRRGAPVCCCPAPCPFLPPSCSVVRVFHVTPGRKVAEQYPEFDPDVDRWYNQVHTAGYNSLEDCYQDWSLWSGHYKQVGAPGCPLPPLLLPWFSAVCPCQPCLKQVFTV
jgi:hypothetical protein